MTTVQKQLQQMAVKPSKKRGQNFISDPRLADEIVSFSELRYGEPVVEVGPGLGILTERIAPVAGPFVIIELEPQFANEAAARYGARPNTEVLNRDVTTVDLAVLPPLLAEGERWVVISNVPYSISTAFLHWLFQHRGLVGRASLLLQREFAERLAASPGGRDYGSLTVFRSLYAAAELGPVISGDHFYPRAEVESRLIRLDFYRSQPVLPCSEEAFERVCRACFAQRRKTLLNNLAPAVLPTKAAAEALLHGVGIDPKRRAETVTLEEFLRLAAAIEGRTS